MGAALNPQFSRLWQPHYYESTYRGKKMKEDFWFALQQREDKDYSIRLLMFARFDAVCQCFPGECNGGFEQVRAQFPHLKDTSPLQK